jgi:hypothetical protein
MPSPEPRPSYKPSQESVELLCERLQRMGVSMSEPAARSLLESVLALEAVRLDALTRGTLQASLEAIRKAADAALISLTGAAPDLLRRDYELSFPPPAPAVPRPSEPVTASGQRRRAQQPRPAPVRRQDPPEESNDDEPRPVFKRRRGR